MKRRIISAILATAMALTLIPTMLLSVSAVDNYELWIGDVQVTSDNKDDVLSDGGKVEYNPMSGTLTLSGVNFTSTTNAAIKVPGDTTITLVGDNTITGADVTKEEFNSALAYGIDCNGSLTINGSGSLNVTEGNATSQMASAGSYGIYARNYSTLTIDGKAKVIANGGATSGHNLLSSGVHANVTLNDGSLTANGGTVSESTESDGIFGSVTVASGILTATGDDIGITDNAVVDGGTLIVCGRDLQAIYGTLAYFEGADVKTNASAEPGTEEYVPENKNSYKWITVRKPLVFDDNTDYDIPAGTAQESFTSTVALTAAGGAAPYTFTIDPSVTGLSVNSENELIYTRPAAQTATTATVRVTDGGNPAQTATITIDIGEVSAITLTTPTGLAWDTETPVKATWMAVPNSTCYSVEIYKVENPAASQTFDTFDTFYDFTSVIKTDGTYAFKVTAVSNNSNYLDSYQSAESPNYVFVAPVAPSIATTTLESGIVGTDYTQKLMATGDTPITWSVSIGALPAGLTLNEATGIISGNPTAAGTFTFTVKAHNDTGDDTKPLSITIAAAPVTTYTITANAGLGGSITPNGEVVVNDGENKTFTITPSIDYSISDVRVDNVSKDAISTYTFTNVTINHTISATFTYNGGSGSTSKTYNIINGANGEWESLSDKGLEIAADGDYKDFLRAEVDGKIIKSPADYTVKSTGTIITLKPEYLKTLSTGQYKLTFVYSNGSVSTNFKVIQQDDLVDDTEIEDEEETLTDNDTPKVDGTTLPEAEVKPQNEKKPEEISADENPATGNSLSGMFEVALISLAAAGVAIKKRRK